jgi:hypothetical protein
MTDEQKPIKINPEQDLPAQGEKHPDTLAKEGKVQLLSLSDFGDMVVAWHIGIQAQYQQILNIPPQELAQIHVADPDHPDADAEGFRELTDPAERRGFLFGIRWAQELSHQLPFDYVVEDADGNLRVEEVEQPVQDTDAQLDTVVTTDESKPS